MLQKPIGETKQSLMNHVNGIQTSGRTALGPAVLTAIALASQGEKGSTVVVCTDGLANEGLGAFNHVQNPAQMAKVDEFYEQIGQLAKNAGVTVNIVSIEGDECNIDSLSKVAELSGGNVDRVNPRTLTKNFASMLRVPVIATQVTTKVKIHKGLEFRNELPANLSADRTLLAKDQGNVTEESMFTFEYTLKPLHELVEMDDIDMTQIKSFPF